MTSPLRSAALQLRTARRVVRRRRPMLRGAAGPLEERMVFVFGSPRSGTTFLAGAIGSGTGFVDLGEVAALKAAVPDLADAPVDTAAARIRRILTVSRRLGLVADLRAVEQTPETAFVAQAVAAAFPKASLVHIVRDGRDVVCSLLDRGWLSGGRRGGDDAGLAYGPQPRFWVEPERRAEFARVSDARRAAWAWRRYVEAARQIGDRAVEVRYERLVTDPAGVAAMLARTIDAPAAELAGALGQVHRASVARYHEDLPPAALADVEQEAGELLRIFGYLQ